MAGQGTPEKIACEAMRIKPNVRWTSQEAGDARTWTVYREKLQTVNRASTRERLVPEQPDVRFGATGLYVCPARFWPCFGLIIVYPVLE